MRDCRFVRCTHCDFAKTTGQIVTESGTDIQHCRRKTLLTTEMSSSKFYVKTVMLKLQ